MSETDLKTGRPSKYKPEFAKKMIDFFEIPPMKEIDIPHYKNGEVSWIDKKRVSNELPKFHVFAKSIKVHRDKISVWAKMRKTNENGKETNQFTYPEFHDAYTYCKELQKYFLIENGLNGAYNPSAFMFVAKNITDMRDVQEIDANISGEVRIIRLPVKKREGDPVG